MVWATAHRILVAAAVQQTAPTTTIEIEIEIEIDESPHP
jgi:hypothetical protein